MRSIRIIILTLITVLAIADASAKTVSWAISPKYDKITRYDSNIFVCEQNGKWGMVKPGNVEVLPVSYDFILPYTNGYSIAGSFSGSRYKIDCIISEKGDVFKISGNLYLPLISKTREPHYFSEGKLAVVDSNGKYGFINAEGNFVVKCQFTDALPFKEGWASVRFDNNLVKYISETYDSSPSRSILAVDFQDGDMTLASCFRDGQAAVAYNGKYALIDSWGNRLKKLKESEFGETFKNNNAAPKSSDGYQPSKTYAEYAENGRYGLKQGEDIIAKAQFNALPVQYSDGYIVADKNGKHGVLTVVDGNYSFDIKSAKGSDSELYVDRKGNVEGININISIPSSPKDLRLSVDFGNGVMQDLTSQLSSNSSSVSASFTPILSANAENCVINATLENDGILVAETSNNFSVSYPIKLRVSQPKAVSYKADKDNNVTIYSNIYNDSNKAVTVKVTLTAKQSVSLSSTIKPHGSVQISLTEKITVAQNVRASVSLSTGERADSTIYLEPYF